MKTSHEKPDRPVVLIVGAGIGGLMMALLLEQINIPYHVFERASEVKPLGSAMSFGGHTLMVLEQLGIYEDLKKVSKEYDKLRFYDGNGKNMGNISIEKSLEFLGYKTIAFSRPDFYEILRKRVPESKISFKKRIIRIQEIEGKVTIHCSDKTSYDGDILVGADGAHSGVRRSMYKQMEQQGILPKIDLEGFSIGYTVIVGVTRPCDPEKFPVLKDDSCRFNQIIYDGSSNCYVITLPNNRISWGFGTQLSQTIQNEDEEWSAKESDSTLHAFREYPNPVGGTMGEMFDATPNERISKVFLEEKFFKTWHHGHTVLIGDACHKVHPAGGQGASNAIFDAVVLANSLYLMKDKSPESIQKAFEEYYNYRVAHAKAAFDSSSAMAKLLNGQKFIERLFRKIVLNYVPSRIYDTAFKNTAAYRPQVAWLPLITDRGSIEAFPQQWEKDRLLLMKVFGYK